MMTSPEPLPGLPRNRVPSRDLIGVPSDTIMISKRMPDGTYRHCAPNTRQVRALQGNGRPMLTLRQAIWLEDRR